VALVGLVVVLHVVEVVEGRLRDDSVTLGARVVVSGAGAQVGYVRLSILEDWSEAMQTSDPSTTRLTLFCSLASFSYAASSLAWFSAPSSLKRVTRLMSLDMLSVLVVTMVVL
jgi:hypothetical protein